MLRFSKLLGGALPMNNQGQFSREILRWVWWFVRLPVVTLLVIMEPVVSLVFGGLALLGVLTVLFYNLIRLPHFPTWTMLSLSVGLGIVVRLYRGVIQVLAR
jgi:hypothetical protein